MAGGCGGVIIAPNSDSGVFLRGQHKSQVNIWCWPVGSGEVWGYQTDPAVDAKVHARVTPKVKANRGMQAMPSVQPFGHGADD